MNERTILHTPRQNVPEDMSGPQTERQEVIQRFMAEHIAGKRERLADLRNHSAG